MGKPLVILPVSGGRRARVHLPFQTGSANYDLIRDLLAPDVVQIKYERAAHVFTVARHHAQDLIDGLARHFGEVEVRQYGWRRTTCVEQCWNAKPESAWDCECACAGTNHGTRTPLAQLVAPGLSIEHDYTVHEYVVTG